MNEKLKDPEIASAFYKEGEIVFKTDDGITYSCDNTKHKSAIFAKDSKSNFSALSEILKSKPKLVEDLIKGVIERVLSLGRILIKKVSLTIGHSPSIKPQLASVIPVNMISEITDLDQRTLA